MRKVSISARVMRLMNRNHTLWGSTARLSYVCGAKSRDMGCSYARGTTRRRDMRDVVAPYVICTILTVGNTGGANPDPRYAGGATRLRNRLLVKNSYASGIFPVGAVGYAASRGSVHRRASSLRRGLLSQLWDCWDWATRELDEVSRDLGRIGSFHCFCESVWKQWRADCRIFHWHLGAGYIALWNGTWATEILCVPGGRCRDLRP
jgi:hypothetical protein